MNLPCKKLKIVADVFQCKEFLPFGCSIHPRLSCGRGRRAGGPRKDRVSVSRFNLSLGLYPHVAIKSRKLHNFPGLI